MTEDLIQTEQDKEEFGKVLEILRQSLFKKNEFETTLNTKIPKKFSGYFLRVFKGRLDRNDIEHAISKLDNYLKTLRLFHMTLAFEPNDKNISDIYLWVKQNFGENIILGLKIDKNIIGGVVLDFDGKYEDLSLKKSIETAFSSNKDQILALTK